MTIHRDHPFDDPDPDPVRRFRGRLGGRVTLWTSGRGDERAGLTVSSVMVALGEPAHVLGLLDPDSDLAVRLEQTGRAVVQLLDWTHRQSAEEFAGLMPAPGGPFNRDGWTQTDWGPVLADAGVWVGVRLAEQASARGPAVGWSWLVDTVVAEVRVGEETEPLLHRRGRYLRG